MKPVIFYGQNREDLILAAFFSDTKKGFYVDVGAHHPIRDSVTKYFYNQGWTGINIEPQEKLFKKLAEDRKNDINLQMGVSDKPGKLTLRSYKSDGLSTFSSDIKRTYEEEGTSEETDSYVDIAVTVNTLANIFAKHKVSHIQFMKVDVEGFEHQVLNGNDWKKFRPEVLCIEANHVLKDWHAFLEENGYSLAFFDGLNEYFVSKEKSYRAAQFQKEYPQILVSAPILSYGWKKQIDKLTSRLREVQAALDVQVAANVSLNTRVAQRNQELKSFRFLAKQLVKTSLFKIGVRRVNR